MWALLVERKRNQEAKRSSSQPLWPVSKGENSQQDEWAALGKVNRGGVCHMWLQSGLSTTQARGAVVMCELNLGSYSPFSSMLRNPEDAGVNQKPVGVLSRTRCGHVCILEAEIWLAVKQLSNVSKRIVGSSI